MRSPLKQQPMAPIPTRPGNYPKAYPTVLDAETRDFVSGMSRDRKCQERRAIFGPALSHPLLSTLSGTCLYHVLSALLVFFSLRPAPLSRPLFRTFNPRGYTDTYLIFVAVVTWGNLEYLVAWYNMSLSIRVSCCKPQE